MSKSFLIDEKTFSLWFIYLSYLGNLYRLLEKYCILDDDNHVQVQNPFKGMKLDNFYPTTEEEVRQIIKEHGVKTSSEDPLPTSLIKSTLDELIPIYVHLVNKSFADGTMNGIKHSEIAPLLKKQGSRCGYAEELSSCEQLSIPK